MTRAALRRHVGAIRAAARARAWTLAGVAGMLVGGLVLTGTASAGPAAAPATQRARFGRTVAVSDVAGGGLFAGSDRAGRAGAEASAVALAERLGGVPVEPGPLSSSLLALDTAALDRRGPRRCPASRLAVSWVPPLVRARVGAFVEPLGPPPTAATRRVNGIVLCRGSNYGYLGFEASWDGDLWWLNAVPASGGDDGQTPSAAEKAAPGASPAFTADLAPPAPDAPVADGWGPAIEPLSDYEPQALCDPTPKPGVVGFRNLALQAFPGSRDLGIGQSCDTPDGVSEHKEGRAFDFGVRIDVPAERAMADRMLTWLFATDRYGNQDAMIRRLGVMYIIWDHRIWGSYRADEGWRPYDGPNPHTDHIHISFDWAGALAKTSFWTGKVGDLRIAPPTGALSFSPLFAPAAPGGPAAAPAAAAPAAPGAPTPSAPAPASATPPSRSGPAPSTKRSPTTTSTTSTTSTTLPRFTTSTTLPLPLLH